MEIPQGGGEGSADAWDWGSLLDFSIEDDDSLILSTGGAPLDGGPSAFSATTMPGADVAGKLPSPAAVLPIPRPVAPGTLGRVRKRDPRLVCSNFLAGKIPCSCPEMDEIEGEEEEPAVAAAGLVSGSRKRGRKEGLGGSARCQVPGCEADISELKGYHRRHRVCLCCANAPAVVLDGEPKRYCQQCGKFHVLPDFDEGKRSCRRKLEHHNRRRRRPTSLKKYFVRKTNSQLDMHASETCTNEIREDISILESEDVPGSSFCSFPRTQNIQNNNAAVSEEAVTDERVDNPKSAVSSVICDDKSTYSSVCPTGRISFKLYDWNPADFPRQLRHQIFQWLASMPVELEGYIRPGCTILTVFIAMPQFMWEKLSQDAALYIRELVNAPESLLWRRGNILIYLANKVVEVMKDGTSLTNINMEVQVPKLHFVYPIYFEAGKPMEIFACGSNLNQARFRFLVSFAGKYLVHDYCHVISDDNVLLHDGSGCSFIHSTEHDMFKIFITKTEAEAFGPAFIEVENASGLSNFIPVLVGNEQMCSEIDRMQKQFEVTGHAGSGKFPSICEAVHSKQNSVSEILLDVAWLIRKRTSQDKSVLTSSNIHRISSLLQFLTKHDFVGILEQIFPYLDNMIGQLETDELLSKGTDNSFKDLLVSINHAQEVIQRRCQHAYSLSDYRRYMDTIPSLQCSAESKMMSCTPNNQDDGAVDQDEDDSEEHDPLLRKAIPCPKDFFMFSGLNWTRRTCDSISPRSFSRLRVALLLMVGTVLCLGACVVILLPSESQECTASQRRCLLGALIP